MSIKVRKACQMITSVYLAVMFSIFLLFFDRTGYQNISSAKGNCYYVLTFTYLAVISIFLLYYFARQKFKISIDIKRIPITSWFILLYLIFTIISACLSEYDTVWLGSYRQEGVLTISLYCLAFLLISEFFFPEKWMLYFLATSVTAFCIICFLQIFGYNPFSLYPVREDVNEFILFGNAFIGTIGNIDSVAAFFCLVIPILWCSILRLRETTRYFLIIPLLLCLIVLFRIQVAAGYVGILIGMLLSLPVVSPLHRKKRLILFISVITILLACIAILYFLDFSQKDLHEMHEVLNGRVQNHFGSGRIYIWKKTLREIPKHFWFGTGPDTMLHMDFSKLNVGNKTIHFDAAHNEYLNILFHQGIFALLSYLCALFSISKKWIHFAGSRPAAAITGAAILSYAIQAFFGISQLIISPFFWCICGMFASTKDEIKPQR